MAKVLAVLEERDGRLASGAMELVSAALELAESLGSKAESLLLAGEARPGGLDQLGAVGLRDAKVVVHEALGAYHPDGYGRTIERIVREGAYRAVLFAATERGKDVAPRLAARMDVPLAQDVTELSVVDGEIRIVRPVFAGKVLSRIRVGATPLVATIRPSAFPVRVDEGAVTVEDLPFPGDPEEWLPYEVLGFEATAGDAPDLSEASVVVSGGRGLGGPEHWGLLESLRDALGGEASLGATRAVVDAGWRPHLEQVGQTGRTVSPRLYFAIGISGAVQHLAGMRTAGVIVAVNRDPDAPIFRIADYGIVGDAFEVVPRLTEEIRALKGED